MQCKLCFLHVKLKHLAKWNELRRERAEEYGRVFEAADNPVRYLSNHHGRALFIIFMSFVPPIAKD